MTHQQSAIHTMSDLQQFLATQPSIPAKRRPHLVSAVRRVRRLLGNGADDFKLDVRAVMHRLAQLSPASAEMTDQSLANLKSLFRAALRHAEPRLASARSQTRLSGAWANLESRLSWREQLKLRPFMRFTQDEGVSPDEVDETTMRAYERHCEDVVLQDRQERRFANTRRAWNNALETLPDWPGQPVETPVPKRISYWLEAHQLSPQLSAEINNWLERRSSPEPFLGGSRNAAKPATIKGYRDTFTIIASALVASGVPAAELTTIATLVGPNRLKVALLHLYARADQKVTPIIEFVTRRAGYVARDLELPAEELKLLEKMLVEVREALDCKGGMTDKNRRLIDKLEDDAFVRRLMRFPHRLVAEAKAKDFNPRIAASHARCAVAAELLLTCSMRCANLASLRLGESLLRLGAGDNRRWVIDLPKEQVKNSRALRFVLPPDSVAILEWYLANWHHHWAGSASPWLFPNGNDGHVVEKILSTAVARLAVRFVGARITCHQFRHIAAELYLQQDPNGIGVVSQHLGHRSLSTTQRYYAREQTKAATQRYQQVLGQRRAAAGPPTRRSRQRDRQPA